ncbi:MAG: hypothetical protein EZS28_009065 [Streblomastix strix]|uniref:Uncharacterized protein n=1 Tax=Streblomastix strix TaxID=222440 RepID=A0A5J4WMC3_9EUKA|nr:MAG: hypothetical protein EZS28_009065 [Streblomastix strix]
MDHATEYNVAGSLLGLGPDILLEMMSQMTIPQDVQNILVLNKKFYKLQFHPRFEKIIQSIGRLEGMKFIQSYKDDLCTIAIDPVIKEGIVRIEIIFEKTNGHIRMCGIADASCSFATYKGPFSERDDKKIVRYLWDGDLYHITVDTKGNQECEDGQRIGIEVHMTTIPRRVTFFINDVEQPKSVIGIPEAIRFWAYTTQKSSSFTITKFERLNKSSAKGVSGSKAFEWGKRWK